MTGVMTKGLKWELDGEKIGGKRIIGQSNLCESDLVRLPVSQAHYLFFFKKESKIKKPRQ